MGVHDTEKYTDIKALLEIPENEPIFILRAQDRLFAPMLGVYEQLYMAAIKAVDPEKESMGEAEWKFADDIDDVRDAGRQWQNRNSDRVKVPD